MRIPPPPQKQCGTGQEVFLCLLSPSHVLWEPTCLQSPSGGPGLDGGAPPGCLHQPNGVPQSLIEVAPQQPADGREVGEIPMAQVFCSRNSELQREKGGKKSRFQAFFLKACCTYRPLGWTTASRFAPGPPAPRRSGRVLRRRCGRRGSERRRRAPGWRWRSREGSGARQALPCLIPACAGRIGPCRGGLPAGLSLPCCSDRCKATRLQSRCPAASRSLSLAQLLACRDRPDPSGPGQLSMSQEVLEEKDGVCLSQPL